ncbi:MAG: hypothetical protein JNL45_11155 [Hyphomicrobium sp.]|jgi:hypothetical protein|nr:hypothetical protein [Hyphomicrobium sp.]
MKWGIARLLGLASFAAAAALFGAGSIRAQQDGAAPEEGEPWALSLAAQLHAEKRCDVQATYFVRELPSAEGTLYSGRVRCIDGREFDFSQSKPHLKFDLKACEPAAC